MLFLVPEPIWGEHGIIPSSRALIGRKLYMTTRTSLCSVLRSSNSQIHIFLHILSIFLHIFHIFHISSLSPIDGGWGEVYSWILYSDPWPKLFQCQNPIQISKTSYSFSLILHIFNYVGLKMFESSQISIIRKIAEVRAILESVSTSRI